MLHRVEIRKAHGAAAGHGEHAGCELLVLLGKEVRVYLTDTLIILQDKLDRLPET